MIRNTLFRVSSGVLLTGFAVLAACSGGSEAGGETAARSDDARENRVAAALEQAAPDGVDAAPRRAYRPLRPEGGIDPDASNFCATAAPRRQAGPQILRGRHRVAAPGRQRQLGRKHPLDTSSTMPLFYQDVMQQQYWDWLSDDYNTLGATVTAVVATPRRTRASRRGTYLSSKTITPSIGDCPATVAASATARSRRSLNHQISIGGPRPGRAATARTPPSI